jgi:hypothetical protein
MTARDDVAAVTAQLSKAKDEILAKLDDLQTAIDNGTVTTADLEPLRQAAQSLDDVVPDTPPEPAPEPPPAGQ